LKYLNTSLHCITQQ